MKRLVVVVAVIAGIASPALAYRDSKLQKAVAKAAGQMQKGQPERPWPPCRRSPASSTPARRTWRSAGSSSRPG